MHLFIYVDICKTIVPRKLTYCLSNLANISVLVMPCFPFIRRGVMEGGNAKVIWWWQFVCSEEWTPDSITMFDWLVKIRSIHDEESPIKCVGSLIICCNPNWEVTPSVLEPWYVVISLLHQRLDFALKSPRATVR